MSAESFALAGDVYVWRGHLDPLLYTTPTPDGRGVTREAAAERLARVVCGDMEMLREYEIDCIAASVAEAQIARTAAAIARVCACHPAIKQAIVTGVGDFVAAAAAARAGLAVRRLSDVMGLQASRCAPASAVALLCAADLGWSELSVPAAWHAGEHT